MLLHYHVKVKNSKSNQIFTLDLTINMLNLKLLISYVTYHKKIVH